MASVPFFFGISNKMCWNICDFLENLERNGTLFFPALLLSLSISSLCLSFFSFLGSALLWRQRICHQFTTTTTTQLALHSLKLREEVKPINAGRDDGPKLIWIWVNRGRIFFFFFAYGSKLYYIYLFGSKML